MTFDDYVTPRKELFSRSKWLSLDSKIAHSEAVLVSRSLHGLVQAYMRMLFRAPISVKESVLLKIRDTGKSDGT